VGRLLPVSAMLAGREKTVTAQAVCLVNIKTALGLLRALIVELGNIPTRQHSAVLIVVDCTIVSYVTDSYVTDGRSKYLLCLVYLYSKSWWQNSTTQCKMKVIQCCGPVVHRVHIKVI